MQIKVKRLSPTAILPVYSTDGAAGFDLFCDHLEEWSSDTHGRIITATVSLGLAFEIPPYHAMLIFARSGLAFAHGVRPANCVPVIDSDYRGDIKIKLQYDYRIVQTAYFPRHGDRIAQGMIIPYPTVQFIEVPKLPDTARGEGGFGSTGV